MTEVYYPDVTVANVHLLQFVVVNPKTKKVETEWDDTISEIEVLDARSLSFIQTNGSESGEWMTSKLFGTDPQNNTVIFDVRFSSENPNLELYVYYEPSLANSGMHDTAWNEGQTLFAREKDIFSCLLFSEGISEISNGFYGVSDGLGQLKRFGKIKNTYARAENGNVTQIAKINLPKTQAEFKKQFTVSLGFGNTAAAAKSSAQTSLSKGFDKSLQQYNKEWNEYVASLRETDPLIQTQFNMAAMQLKAHEDTAHRGANIASLSVPWGGGENANENSVGGYRLVWSRDLYQVATAFMALGDTAAANRALEMALPLFA